MITLGLLIGNNVLPNESCENLSLAFQSACFVEDCDDCPLCRFLFLGEHQPVNNFSQSNDRTITQGTELGLEVVDDQGCVCQGLFGL